MVDKFNNENKLNFRVSIDCGNNNYTFMIREMIYIIKDLIQISNLIVINCFITAVFFGCLSKKGDGNPNENILSKDTVGCLFDIYGEDLICTFHSYRFYPNGASHFYLIGNERLKVSNTEGAYEHVWRMAGEEYIYIDSAEYFIKKYDDDLFKLFNADTVFYLKKSNCRSLSVNNCTIPYKIDTAVSVAHHPGR